MARVKLAAPYLCDEASVGPNLIHVDNDGMVDVTETQALALGAVGFQSTIAQPLAPEGHVTIKGEPRASCSFGGATYTADDDGYVVVPAIAVDALEAHGFAGVDTVAKVELAPAPVETPVEALPEAAIEAPASEGDAAV